jgi:hypothetical protein
MARASLTFLGIAAALCNIAQAEGPGFNRDVRPILSDRCFQCHGPDTAARKAKLRLDVFEDGPDYKGASSVITAGAPESSDLYSRIIAPHADDLMPPPEINKPLTESEIATLAEWIRHGAAYEAHWSYTAIHRPELPAEERDPWVRNPIDAFVLQRLRAEGLEPAPEADPVTLARRAHFDLTGLPPEPGVVDAFEADPSPANYEAMVDALLASPHYGEHMAADWLDQVRYADTNGFHSDEERSVWPYRDYVISAFNENMPFDQFTREQLGGDLMPNATQRQKVAASYNRLNQITAEGGAQPGEYLAMYAADRVRTASTVWMGATMACAQCHDHKFDPFTIREFYSMAAFFADIQEQGVYGGGSRWEPVLELPSDEQAAKLAELDRKIALLKEHLTEPTPRVKREREHWMQEQGGALEEHRDRWLYTAPAAITSENGTTFTTLEDGSVLAGGADPDHEVYTLRLEPGARSLGGVLLEALPHESMPNGLSRANGNFVLTEIEAWRVAADGARERIALEKPSATYEQEPNHQAATALDGDPATGWAVLGHERKLPEAAVFAFAEKTNLGQADALELVLRFNHAAKQHTIGRLRVAVTERKRPTVRMPRDLEPAVFHALLHPGTPRHPTIDARLTETFLAQWKEFDDEREALAAAEAERTATQAAVPYVLATVAVPPRPVRVLARGNWMDESGEIVEPGVPAALPPLHVEGRRATRLDLAEWLMSPENPLPARVYANRLWKRHFGRGLSKVLDDLGSQGEWPTHPELLDWLAAEFRDSGWNVKHMVRLILTSSAYRQASAPPPALRERDPGNKLVARQGRFRLAAESVRDNALAISGLLTPAIGGPSVYPYQPDGYYANCNTFGRPLNYINSPDENQYRRGMYTFWKRSFLHPSLLAFDAPAREECTADRVVSNTPLQALVLLNDPTYVEAARVLAQRLLETEADDTARIDLVFERALSRPALPEEEQILLALLQDHRASYAAAPDTAASLAKEGNAPAPANADPAELAAWTSVARAVLNMHETLTRY